jgi:hypothetical protein
MNQPFTATFSPVDPADNVTERNFHQFDKNGAETVFRIDPSVTSFDSSIDDSLTPGSCLLIDINANGPSEPSPSFALAPNVPPPPPPPPTDVPKAPTILSVTWANQQAGGVNKSVVDRRGK